MYICVNIQTIYINKQCGAYIINERPIYLPINSCVCDVNIFWEYSTYLQRPFSPIIQIYINK